MLASKPYIAFAAWLRRESPTLFNLALQGARAQSAGLGDLDLSDVSLDDTSLPEIDVTADAGDLNTGIDFSSINSLSAATSGADILPDFTGSIQADNTLSDPSSYAVSSGAAPVVTPSTSTVSSALNAVGNFLSTPSNVRAITNAAATVVTATEAANVINAQAARAAAGQAPANVQYQTTYDPSTGEIAAVPTIAGNTLTAQQIANIQPSFLQRYGILLGVFAVAAVVLME